MRQANICKFYSRRVEEMNHQGQELPQTANEKPFIGSESFPFVLHTMLDEIESQGLSNIVSWQPHGRCFVVHKRKEFVELIMPVYFRMSKFASFQRQLNLYGFHRITTGQDQRGYYHECFLRGRRELCTMIHRQQVKGTGVRQPASPANEPNFYLMDYLPQSSRSGDCKASATAAPTTNSLSEIFRHSSKLASETAVACSMATVLYPTPSGNSSSPVVHSTSLSPAAAACHITNNNPMWQSQQPQQGYPPAFGQTQQQQYMAPLFAAMPSSLQLSATQYTSHSTAPPFAAAAGTVGGDDSVAHATAPTGVFGSDAFHSIDEFGHHANVACDRRLQSEKAPITDNSRCDNSRCDAFDTFNQHSSPQHSQSGSRNLRRQPIGLDRSFDNLVAALLSGTLESTTTASSNCNTPFDGATTDESTDPPA